MPCITGDVARDGRRNRYTDPELRERLKAEIKASDKGGRPGQWSARKSQFLVQEYERRGGGYRGGKDRAARSLERWTAQEWSTRSGAPRARTPAGTRRYLPRQVWHRLSESERREAERTKARAEARGRTHVPWPAPVRQAMRELGSEDDATTKAALYRRAQQLGIHGRSRMTKAELAQAVRQAGKDARGTR